MDRGKAIKLILAGFGGVFLSQNVPSLSIDFFKDTPKKTLSELMDKYLTPAKANLHLRGMGIQNIISKNTSPAWLTPLSMLEYGEGLCDELALAHYVLIDPETVLSKHLISFTDFGHYPNGHSVMVYQDLDRFWGYTSNLNNVSVNTWRKEVAIIKAAYDKKYEPRDGFRAWELFPEGLGYDWKTKRGDIDKPIHRIMKRVDIASYVS